MNLTEASFISATLTDVNFTNAEVRAQSFGGFFLNDQGLTEAQLYSTASYQAGDLTGLGLWFQDLTGWDFSGKNLTDAFLAATLTDADFTARRFVGRI